MIKLKKILSERLKRFKVFVSGESKPLILMGRNAKEVKQIAYAMIKNSSVKIKKIVKEEKLNEKVVDKPEVGDYFEWDDWIKLGQIIKIDRKQAYIKPLKGTFGKAVVSIQYKIKNIKLFGQHKGKKLWTPK
tara:strand:- start:129 stop:524 length:396 start_codon:yes stop_codon:yes gene_type:complete